MTPTNKLRFVEREVQVPAPELGPNITKTIKVRIPSAAVGVAERARAWRRMARRPAGGGSMTNREQLELAAKAAGIDVFWWFGDDPVALRLKRNNDPWNPLTDDGDAFRLAVKLRKMPVIERWSDGHDWVFIPGHEGGALPLGDDPLAATRRAIVRAAAEIGRSVK